MPCRQVNLVSLFLAVNHLCVTAQSSLSSLHHFEAREGLLTPICGHFHPNLGLNIGKVHLVAFAQATYFGVLEGLR